MTPLLPLILVLPASGARKKAPAVPTVPTVEAVVESEGFTATPSQSEVYRPGAVLVPNARGSHDEVVTDCIGIDPSVSIMSQSSIATTLSAGVSARFGVGDAAASAGIEKRLTFIDPEQRTIPLGLLQPTAECQQQVERASRLADLSEAIVVHDVLVAIIQNTVCTRADAKGGVVALGQAEAAAFSECIQESDAQVPLGFKGVALAKLMGAPAPVVSSRPASPAPGAPAAATSSAHFGAATLDVSGQLREQACVEAAQASLAQSRARRLDEAARDAQSQARAAWSALEPQASACVQLPRADRSPCIASVESWLAAAGAMVVSLPAASESTETDCGARTVAFASAQRSVEAQERPTAERLLSELQRESRPAVQQSTLAAPPPAAPARASAGVDNWIPLTQLASLDAIIGTARSAASQSPSALVVLANTIHGKQWRKSSDRGPVCAAARRESSAARQQVASTVDLAKLKSDTKHMNAVLVKELKASGLSPAALPKLVKQVAGASTGLVTVAKLSADDVEKACK